ncbi:DUF885 family protein [Massilia sp. TS11]|uniref:DUF885 domain-containing protein n=1 Tax=Massilia sp. TS11 TaxID=2908003 RepID=UPI001EDACE17|nr:DUF885 domain-containing protein [Massilia sp. TS11]MCG2584128.1 DUF885 domain-containing protein [Massilia sp. TS11]
MKRSLITLSLLAAFGSIVPAAPALAAAPAAASVPYAAFDQWAERFSADWARQVPEMATISQYFSGKEQQALDGQLTPQTPAARAARVALAKQGLAGLAKFDKAPLDATQRISQQTMRWTLENAVANAAFEDFNFAFDQFRGVHVNLVNFLSNQHPIRNADDIANYQNRLEQVAERVDEALARSRSATARGMLPPRFILERAQAQVDAFLKPDAVNNVLVSSLAERSAKVQGLDAAQRQLAVARATATVERSVRPAWQRIAAYLAELHPKTTATAGISRLPGGDKAYARALENYTSTKLTAEQIHAIGLREVARLEAEMDKHLRSLGLTEGDVETRMNQLDARLSPPASPDPRPEILAKYKAYVKDALERSKAVFNLMPKAPVDVRREPAITEPTAAAHYTVPAPDGSLPGVFWVPLRGPSFNIPRMRSLSYHEAVPGHHFQLAIVQEEKGLPKYRSSRLFSGGSANSEGWALYAERLAVEQGWYKDDVPGLLGALGSELFRARRLVVDTGIHAKGWTREQGIAYGIGAQEVERYVAMPGQACAYMIGMLRILELREKAQKALGAKFDLKAFHDVILRAGVVPLDVLSATVESWIASQKA